jgi:hypothetical protein
MAQAPPLTVLPFQAVSGSYRMRDFHASARSQKTGHGADRFTCPLTRADQTARQPDARHDRGPHGEQRPRVSPARRGSPQRHDQHARRLTRLQGPQPVGNATPSTGPKNEASSGTAGQDQDPCSPAKNTAHSLSAPASRYSGWSHGGSHPDGWHFTLRTHVGNGQRSAAGGQEPI